MAETPPLQKDLFYRLKYSDLYYNWAMQFKSPEYFRELHADRRFYRQALQPAPRLIFDVGANKGEKAWIFRQIAQQVVCVEPDGRLFTHLTARYGRDRRMLLEQVALGEREGAATLYVNEDSDASGYNTLSEKQRGWVVSHLVPRELKTVTVQVSTLDALIAKYGVPDFLKVDVEGYEAEVFKGLSHRVPLICFEANLPHFRSETLEIVSRFARDGQARFNLRHGFGFLFPSYVGYEQVCEALNTDEATMYDVFVRTCV